MALFVFAMVAATMMVRSEWRAWEAEHSAEALSALQVAHDSLETIARSYVDVEAVLTGLGHLPRFPDAGAKRLLAEDPSTPPDVLAGDVGKVDIALNALALELIYLDAEVADRLAKVKSPVGLEARATWEEAVSAVAALSNSWYTRAAILMQAERLLTEPTDEELAALEGLSAAVDRAYLAVEAARGAIACATERLSCM